MKKHEGNIKAFFHLSKAWYGEANLRNADIKDQVMFGYYTPGEGTTGEMSMRWHQLGGELTPRLDVFNDAWHALSTFTDVIQELGKVDNQHISPDEFCKILLSLGFKDLTPTKSPYEKPVKEQEESELLHAAKQLIVHKNAFTLQRLRDAIVSAESNRL